MQFDANTLQGGKGSGLGLWLSKAIVEMHGGVIGATSEGAGKGCTFFLEIPCVVVRMESDATPEIDGNFDFAENTCESEDEDATVRLFDDRKQPRRPVKATTSHGSDDRNFPLPRLFSGASISITPSVKDTCVELNTMHSSPERRYNALKCEEEFASMHVVERDKSPRQKTTSKELKGSMTGLKVLLVDDSALARKMVERMLTDAGFHCHHACNGLQAVEKVTEVQQAGEQPFDVVLMDCYMPVMNGPEAVQHIRGTQCGFRGVVLAVTGADSDTSEFYPMLGPGGVDRIMVKPFHLPTFQKIIEGKIEFVNYFTLLTHWKNVRHDQIAPSGTALWSESYGLHSSQRTVEHYV